MTQPDDLWQRMAGGDAEAFNALYRDHAQRLCAFVRQITGNRAAAEDIVQETFIGIWQKPADFHPERGSVRAYLYGIARKRASGWWRQHPPVESSEEPEPSASTTELASLLRNALATLPEDQRLLLWLREIEGQSYAELAAILDIPIGTVRSRLFAAREALRRTWYADRNRDRHADRAANTPRATHETGRKNGSGNPAGKEETHELQ